MKCLHLIHVLFIGAAFACSTQVQAAFPAVDQATQKKRDDTRLHILATELSTEKAALAAARTALASAPADRRDGQQKEVDRHAENVQALNDELSNIGRVTLVSKTPSTGCQPPPAFTSMVRTVSDSATPYWAVRPWQPTTAGIQPVVLTVPPVPAVPKYD